MKILIIKNFLFAGLLSLFWLASIQLPVGSLVAELDPSWQAAITDSVAHGRQFGADVIFTFGPLGFVTAPTYTGKLLIARVVGDLLFKAAFAAFMAYVAIRLKGIMRLVFIFSGVVFSLYAMDAVYLCLILFATATATRFAASFWSLSIAGVVLGFVALVKVTFLVVCPSCLLVLGGYLLWKRKMRGSLVLFASFVLAFLAGWGMAGQHLVSLPTYLWAAVHVISGYSEIYYLNKSFYALICGLIAVSLASVLIFTFCFMRRAQGRAWAIGALFLGSTFLAWKEGFVRADGHALTTFVFLQFALPAAWVFLPPPRNRRKVLLGLTAFTLLLAFVGCFLIRPTLKNECIELAYKKFHQNISALSHFQRFRLENELRLSRLRNQYALPQIKKIIGDSSVDYFGHEEAVVLLNDLNYRPRPMFEKPTAYNGFLIGINGAFYRGTNKPQYVILKYQTIDNRFSAAEDTAVLDAILRNYEILLTEKGYLLARLKTDTAAPFAVRLLPAQEVSFEERIMLPDDSGPVWVAFDIQETWLGKIRNFFYKPFQITLQVETKNGEVADFRVSRLVAQSGFMINPALCDEEDFRELVLNPRYRNLGAIRIHIEDAARPYYRGRFLCQLSIASEFPTSAIPEALLTNTVDP